MTTLLGINAFHGDASACLVRDGELIAAAEEERFRRIKHWAGFPAEAIRYCLGEAGLTLAAVDHVAVNQDSKANLGKKIAFTLTKRPDLGLVLDRIRNKRERDGIDGYLARAFPGDVFRGRVHAVEHHVAHLSSAFHVSPFRDAVAVSVDGFGDFASAAWGVGHGTAISVDDRVYFPHSLGIFYQALTQWLGFPNYGDEYKVMGLAPYGQPTALDAMRRIVRLEEGGGFRLALDYFRHHREKIDYEWENGSPTVGKLYAPALEDLLGPARASDAPLTQRHQDIARSVQAMYEEAFFHLLNALHARHGLDAAVIAGGCGNNSVANGKITMRTPQPATPEARSARLTRSGTASSAARVRRLCATRTGARSSTTRRSAHCWTSGATRSPPPAAASSTLRTRATCAGARRRPSPAARSSAGSRAGWSGARGRSAIARSFAIRVAPT